MWRLPSDDKYDAEGRRHDIERMRRETRGPVGWLQAIVAVALVLFLLALMFLLVLFMSSRGLPGR